MAVFLNQNGTPTLAQDVPFVQGPVGRLMGDEHVRIVRDEIPVFANLDQALTCKGPISALPS